MDGSLPAGGALRPLRALFGELGDLKRIRSADREGSIAERGFRSAWRRLVAGAAPADAMRSTVAAALAAARLGDLDGPKLAQLGFDRPAALDVLRRGFDTVSAAIDPSLTARLREGVATDEADAVDLPAFVRQLERQPRAGATCPGKPRLVLEPPESHAEHCWAVAVFGVLLSPVYSADPATVFVAALAHHLHNALMPDSGFTGEVLLGDRLQGAIDHATAAALAQLEAPLRGMVTQARAILPDAGSPEGRAFHAADVIDRVMQIAQHLRPGAITMATVLDHLQLVHDGPVKPFHDGVLAEIGLL